MKFRKDAWNLKTKITFFKGIFYFYPILPQIAHT